MCSGPTRDWGPSTRSRAQPTSTYNGVTVLLKGQVGRQFFIRAGYTFAKAIDDGADSLVVGRPGNVQNAYATQLERGLSVTDQRQRFVASTVYEPASFHYQSRALNAIFNNWKASSVFTMGSGRPINATMAGDSNRDDNAYNDRLPGAVRNAYIGPGYFTVDLRISKGFQLSERVRLTLLAESFNVANRVNQRVDITDDGFLNSAGQFVAYSTKVGKTLYPGEFIKNSKFLIPDQRVCSATSPVFLKSKFLKWLNKHSGLFSAARHGDDWGASRGSLCLTSRRKIGITEKSVSDEFGGVFPLAEVRIQEGESLENALRRFKRKVQTEDIIKEVKRHSFYLKPGEKKRVKEALARKRSRKKARKEQD